MFVNESDFVRVIKRAYKAGSLKMEKQMINNERILIIEGTKWKWQCAMENVNKKILATLVELCGFIPEDGERWNIGKDMDAQSELQSVITWVDVTAEESKVMDLVLGIPAEGEYRFVNASIDGKRRVKTISNFLSRMMEGRKLKTEANEIYLIATEDYMAYTTGDEQLMIYWQQIPVDYPDQIELYTRLEGLEL